MVWIIDDDDIFKFVITFQIEHLTGSKEFMTFSDIPSAIEAFGSAEKYPSVILMDINFPNLNGWDFLNDFIELIKSRNSNTQIFMVSSSISRSDQEMLLKFPYVRDLLEKPLEDSVVVKILNE